MTSDDKWDPSTVDNDGPNLEGIANHADVVRIQQQQDRRIDDLGNVVELDIKQVVQSPDHCRPSGRPPQIQSLGTLREQASSSRS